MNRKIVKCLTGIGFALMHIRLHETFVSMMLLPETATSKGSFLSVLGRLADTCYTNERA